MTFLLCSKRPDEDKASISFSGSNLANFGFTKGCKVAVDISKGKIIITILEGNESVTVDNNYVEGI